MLTVRTDIGSHSILTQSNHVTKHLRIAWGPATDTGFPLANLGKREKEKICESLRLKVTLPHITHPNYLVCLFVCCLFVCRLLLLGSFSVFFVQRLMRPQILSTSLTRCSRTVRSHSSTRHIPLQAH